MKQRYAVIVLFALIVASSLTSFSSYSSTSRLVNEDMDRALAIALEEQQSNVISQDTILTFNNHLQIPELRGKATLAVDTRGQKFKAYAHCSEATIFAISDQRFAAVLWAMTIIWATFCLYRRKRIVPLLANMTHYGGLSFSYKNRNLQCPLAKETRCQRDPIHTHPTHQTCHRGTLQLKNRIRQGKGLRIENKSRLGFSNSLFVCIN